MQGKVIWITGASSGIGEALAVELFREGATLILTARNENKLNELKTRLDQIERGRCYVVTCDVRQLKEIELATDRVRQLTDRVDILVNNAGVSQRSYVLDTSVDVYRELLEVNFFSAVSLTKGILPWMISKGGGHVVIMSSMAGKYGFRMRSGYAAAKHALHGFFETMRAELHDRHINVTMICPGRVQTDVSVHSLTGDGKQYGKIDPSQTHGIPVRKCARIIVRAIKHNRKEVFIGGAERFLLFVKRICPPFYYWIVNRASPT